ncbi:hypothetical protein B0A48_02515 [Cryoendolithus antarcticus]|uniref:N-acetylglucosamine-6-phosphate deacetylase n=1 Tax=Cryoendolithus antarcticus TaxID=1507870 RepID=A0A1V8TP66_9PEZI|nr:hypothetical protein B0A48_02515 [Cryoendolithus antarcticus]
MTTRFTKCRICRDGKLVNGEDVIVSTQTGLIVESTSKDDDEVIDLGNKILAPGFIELQTNGMRGFHFTHFEDDASYQKKLDEVARYLPSTGVTAFYATIPTVSSDDFKKILPSLVPREISGGAALLGAHAEGPYLHPDKKGAHNSSLFHPPSTSPLEVYGSIASSDKTLKLVTLAPELVETDSLIKSLVANNIRVSLGHSTATYDEGLSGLKSGATCLTHTLNAMPPLSSRTPGLAGLVTSSHAPYYSIIIDGHHLHPTMATLLFRSNPSKCIIITDSIELAGLEDGTYPGHAQIPFNQTKIGSRVVIEGTETLIGGCAGLGECVANLVRWSGCSVPEGVRCVTSNIVGLMGERERGRLELGRRADLVVLSDEGEIEETNRDLVYLHHTTVSRNHNTAGAAQDGVATSASSAKSAAIPQAAGDDSVIEEPAAAPATTVGVTELSPLPTDECADGVRYAWDVETEEDG